MLPNLLNDLKGMGEIVRYSHYSSSEPFPDPSLTYISYGGWDRSSAPCETDLFVPDYMTYSDYSGGTVERANQVEFMRLFGDIAGVFETSGGFGTTGIAVSLSAITDEMLEIFQGLQDYPCIDDGAILELEMELENESWPHVERDLIRKIEKLVETCAPLGWDDPAYNLVSEHDWTNWFYSRMEETNTYWLHEDAVHAWVDLDRLMLGVTFADIQSELTNAEIVS